MLQFSVSALLDDPPSSMFVVDGEETGCCRNEVVARWSGRLAINPPSEARMSEVRPLKYQKIYSIFCFSGVLAKYSERSKYARLDA